MLLIYLFFVHTFTADTFAAYAYSQGIRSWQVFFLNGQMRRLYAYTVNEFALWMMSNADVTIPYFLFFLAVPLEPHYTKRTD